MIPTFPEKLQDGHPMLSATTLYLTPCETTFNEPSLAEGADNQRGQASLLECPPQRSDQPLQLVP